MRIRHLAFAILASVACLVATGCSSAPEASAQETKPSEVSADLKVKSEAEASAALKASNAKK